MKRIIVIVTLFICPLLLFGQEIAFVRNTSGKVEMSTEGQWHALSPGTTVPIGATISTGFGASATLEIRSAIIEVRALTRMRIDELVEREGVLRTDVFLPVGRVRAEVRGVDGLESEFRLRSTQATAAVRGTSFDFDGRNLRVLSGRVQLTNQAHQRVNVATGESTEASDTGELSTGSEVRERATVVQVAVTAFEEAATTFLQRRDELGTGVIRIEWEAIPQ